MLDFYKKALTGLVVTLLFSAVVTYLCVQHTFLNVALLPSEKSEIRWHPESLTDVHDGGTSISKLNDAHYSLDYEFTIHNIINYPSASIALVFEDHLGQPEFKDFSNFNRLSFMIKCSVPNELTFMVFTLDEQITQEQDFLTYRTPIAFFSCNDNWSQVELDLTRLELPQWWLEMFHLKFSMNDYQLDKVAKFQIGSTRQSPKEIATRVQISEMNLKGNDWLYIYLLAATLFVFWAAYLVWCFKQHAQALTAELKDKFLRERPLVAYRQLSMEPQRDKSQKALLQFMATNYANPELSLDIAMAETGVSRTKINDILKAELGFTFTGYLNKLRLTEAARLLADVDEANIAEIAYSVGYKNVSYFNKLFKEEYGCTPKTFKSYL
ncbi:AraC family transcriptional regulator [Paraglaciecola hydrolytica]|uniref:AraC family transcriptional regulator n=1 Tax=Paraglaciecola hydrolytica TaxID=1799789 RepID=A0A136A4P4_9ALTE|nr:helix-turn-helix domain-containing protein [Paraglaciecola hydrolytica]KXI30189.1 AraC family transcriptional regulator [Paraglaciecola hydrolytica]